jgi:hypothetical protein
MLSYLGDLLLYVTLPTFGIVTLVLFVGGIGWACVALLRRDNRSKDDAGIGYGNFAPRAVFCLGIGSILGIAALADHNLTIFIKHKVPLIAAPIFLVKALAIAGLIVLFMTSSRRWRRVSAAVGIVLLVSDHAAIQYFNFFEKTPYRFTWIDEVSAHPEATYAISWDPTAVSIFTNTRSIPLSLRDELALEQLVTDSSQTGARPRIVSSALNDLPDYWLYFPTDAMSPFDSFNPRCRLDYVSNALISVMSPAGPTFQAGSSWVRPLPAPPGGYVAFGGTIDTSRFRNAKLVKLRPADHSGQISSNCKRGTLNGWLQTSERQPEGDHVISFELQTPEGGTEKVDIGYKLSAGAPPGDFEHPALLLQLPMLSANEMRQRMSLVPVAKSGPGWVLFDLRGLKRPPA